MQETYETKVNLRAKNDCYLSILVFFFHEASLNALVTHCNKTVTFKVNFPRLWSLGRSYISEENARSQILTQR